MSYTPLIEAFNLIVQNQVLSIPIFDVEKQKHIGFLDLVDILYFLMDVLLEEEALLGYERFKHKFSTQTCKSVMNISRRNPFECIGKSASLGVAARLMQDWLVHRLPVINENGEFVAILSQSKLSQVFSYNVRLFPFSSRTIRDLGLGLCEVYTVKLTDRTCDAYDKMRKFSISGIAVVNQEGMLLEVLSVSDLRLLCKNLDQVGVLYSPVAEFLQRKKEKILPITVTPSSTIADLADTFLSRTIHRVFVVDVQFKPVGVITLGDYLKLFVSR
eukprot:TRINITY_DN2312_c0_g1_i14.p1 TRINITY_DN2312_c0_g1~~TRINITY_DN2312_c0_g1_i14.p1  ORF type:complete len:273 (-),score=40.69 TRINITY_DN2312_c0_g1_i14:173-991(-)